MTVLRIVADIATKNSQQMEEFYKALFDLDVAMSLGWITTMASTELSLAQLSFMSEGGSGAPIPDLSIEVDNVDDVYRRAQGRGCDIPYELTNEPWNVRRFFVVDPSGKILNVLTHLG